MVGLRNSEGNVAAPPFTKGPYEWDQHVTLQKRGIDSYNRYVLEERFEKLPQINATVDQVYTTEAARICNTSFEIQGTSAADADITFKSTLGAVELKTHGAQNDQVMVLPHDDTNYTAWTGIKWGSENQVIWEAVVRTGSSIADVVLMVGLRLTALVDISGDADAAFFRYDGNVANWEATTSIGGTDVETDSGVAVAASTNYYFRIEIDSDRKPHFFIDNKEVYVGSALENDKDFIPVIGVQYTAVASASKYLYLVKERISRIIYE